MRKFVLIIGLLCWFFSGMAEEKKSIIFKVDIKDEIGPGVWRLVKRSYEEAGQSECRLYIDTHEHLWRNGCLCRFAAEPDTE